MRLILAIATCFGALTLFSAASSAQIVNVQPVLNGASDEGFAGEFGGSVDYKSGNVNLLLAQGTFLAAYKTGDHRFISSSKGEVGFKDDNQFMERVFSHLRWQMSVNAWLTWETFGQVATDEFKSLQVRGLAGTGPRFELVTGPAVSAAFGVLYMFEHEVLSTSEDGVTLTSNDHRISAYITGKFAVSPLLSLGNTTYFQPNLSAFADDFRLSSETSLNVALSAKLALSIAFTAAYDHAPPTDIESLDMSTSARVTLKL